MDTQTAKTVKSWVDGVTLEGPFGPMPDLPAAVPGVYETLLIRKGHPVFWSEHWTRFEDGCRAFQLPPPIKEAELRKQVDGLVQANGITLGVARYAVWRQGDGVKARIDVSPPRPHMSRPEFRVAWAQLTVGPTAMFRWKNLYRGHWLHAARSARQAGFDEALLIDTSGRLVEGGGANVFLVKAGVIGTPDYAGGPLPGVMRGQVLALARERGWAVREGLYGKADVEHADEIWMTNSIIGLRRVVQIGETVFPDCCEVFQRLRLAWQVRHGWDPVVVA